MRQPITDPGRRYVPRGAQLTSPLKRYFVELSLGRLATASALFPCSSGYNWSFSRHCLTCQSVNNAICHSGPPAIPSKLVQARVAFSLCAGRRLGTVPTGSVCGHVHSQRRQSMAMMMCSCATAGRTLSSAAEQNKSKFNPQQNRRIFDRTHVHDGRRRGGAPIQQRPPSQV